MPRKPAKIAAFTPYFTEEEAEQVRAAYLVAKDHEDGVASASDFIVRATMRDVKRIQRKYNGGKKLDPVPAGALRRGQRTREELQHRNEDS
ncbi:MAG TPA: hypothetical protein VGK98_13175 [Arthrobacter sp.]|uniref:ParB family protein n=1 Tax=Arthrobacter sp. TaxID=1667 RepID=UPI002F421617